jgi:hypothetical protein
VTNTNERDEDLGVGKWAASGRSLAEVKSEMDSTPVRELEIQEPGLPWGRIILFVLLSIAAGLYLWEPAEAPKTTAGLKVQTAQEAAPTQAMVTVQTEPAGGTVSLDGTIYGAAPVTVPVPADPHTHKLCVQHGAEQTCRDLTGLVLSKDDPYVFKTTLP